MDLIGELSGRKLSEGSCYNSFNIPVRLLHFCSLEDALKVQLRLFHEEMKAVSTRMSFVRNAYFERLKYILDSHQMPPPILLNKDWFGIYMLIDYSH